ncbi:C4-dicarboxylate transporter/malic acid transport protein [Micromonospora narathiwatensis]|uniref:C4-dicarboxylate transporter/malic acid transport protein n=2 Tax=Micromonospora narathiwatensis TaxID=299146 RepID=A0A1A9AE95_9ACTN|nr:C4-dicarboxylate transporter/malic acid transport protein [Micromonospora narathiwatensis]
MARYGIDAYRPGRGGPTVDHMNTLPQPPTLPRRRPDVVGRPAPLSALAQPRDVFAYLGPNWFASVMGTGIVATAAAGLPLRLPGLRFAATVVWAAAALLLVALIAAWAVHLRRHRNTALGYAADPVMAQFWGAPPMALMTVGGGALLLGGAWLGESAAVAIDLVLWSAGTGLGLLTTVAIPYLMMTRHRIGPDAAFAGWLMPVVPPMVSAANGALLVPYLPPGQARLDLVIACYAMFGISLAATVIILPQLWARLVTHRVGAARMVPTLWIVLGPLGQSITAAHLLGRAAEGVLPDPYAAGAQMLAVLYGVPVMGFALLWLALAAAITVRTARAGLPFSLTWWSFTFPVGTLVTGVTGLAARSGSALLAALAVLLYALLLAAWATVATRTVRGAWHGHLFLPPTTPA